MCGQFLGRPLGHDVATTLTPLGAEVNDPVCGLDDLEVVLDHDHRVPLVDQRLQRAQQRTYIVEVQSRGRLVEDEERRQLLPLTEVVGKLDTLVLSARERGARLSELDVAEAYALQRTQLIDDAIREGDCSRCSAKKSTASSTLSSSSWEIFVPQYSTSRSSLRKRLPPQASQVR